MRSPAPTPTLPWLLGLALLLGSCASALVSAHPDFELRRGQSYAWSPASLARLELALDDPGETLGLPTLRQAIDERLGQLGLVAGQRADADYILEASLAIDEAVYSTDPYFANTVAERVELGQLTLTLRQRTQPERFWSASASERLRATALAQGGLDFDFHPTDQQRVWPVGELVDRLLDELPVQD